MHEAICRKSLTMLHTWRGIEYTYKKLYKHFYRKKNPSASYDNFVNDFNSPFSHSDAYYILFVLLAR